VRNDIGAARRFSGMAAVVAAVACTACLDTSTLVTVKPDGSGTIQQRILVSTDGIDDALGGMGFKSKGGSSKKSGPAKAGDLRADSEKLGDGVELVSVEPVTAPAGFQGAVATYSFLDIRKLRVDEFLSPGQAGSSDGGDSRTAFTFTKTPDGTALLSIVFDEKPKKRAKGDTAAPKGGPGMDDAKTREMVRTLFRGFKVGLDVEVVGDIVRTIADHVNGRRITLMAFDMDALLADDSKLKHLDKVLSPDVSLAEARPLLAGVDGIKINKPIVKIEFR
jgi:hypothetical protein